MAKVHNGEEILPKA